MKILVIALLGFALRMFDEEDDAGGRDEVEDVTVDNVWGQIWDIWIMKEKRANVKSIDRMQTMQCNENGM